MKQIILIFITILALQGCQFNWRETQQLCGITYADMWNYCGANAIYIKDYNPESIEEIRSLLCFSHCFLSLKEKEIGHPVLNKISIFPKEFATAEDIGQKDFPIAVIHLSPSPSYEVQKIVTRKKGQRLKTYDAKMLKDSLVCHCPTLPEKRNQLFRKHVKSLKFSGKVSGLSTEGVDSGFVNVVIGTNDVYVLYDDYFYRPIGPKGYPNCAIIDDRICYSSDKVVITFSKQFVEKNLNIGSFIYSDLYDSRIFFNNKDLYAKPYNSLHYYEWQLDTTAKQITIHSF